MEFLKNFSLLLLLITMVSPLQGQDLFKDKNIDSSFTNYTKNPREIAYSHLNKSTYIVGEDIGFTTYIINNTTNSFSDFATNLYCVVKNKEDKIIKKQLIRVKNGVAYNSITIDSLFTSGEYKFFAFTNWIKNFNEQNFFVATIKIIDPKKETVIKNKAISDKIDAQFLPESGHLLANTENKIGVIIKNELGLGLANITGELVQENKTLTTFIVNKLGIGSFVFTPELNKKYQVKIIYNNKETFYNLTKTEVKGITLAIKKTAKGLNVLIKTNKLTIPELKGKTYFLIVHNGKKLKKFPIKFNKLITLENFISPYYLNPGINIITLFDDSNNPIAERLYFNYENIKSIKSNDLTLVKRKDSTTVNLTFKDIVPSKLNNISISALPLETKSYQHHHTILSYYYLKPYIKGTVENAKYYFTNVNEQTKKDIDNLLLTQGWSSYNWYSIFNDDAKTRNFIENGISVKVKIRNKKKGKYIIHPVGKNKPNYYVLEKDEHQFLALGLFPKTFDNLKLSSINEKGILKPLTSYLAFYPNRIPDLNQKYTSLSPKKDFNITSSTKNSFFNSSLNETQQLKEVVIKSKINETRIENIKRRTFGKVHVFSDIDRKRNISFQDYIRNKGYSVVIEKGLMTIDRYSEASTIHGGSTPTIYLNGRQLFDFSDLAILDMSEVDYIDINKNGIGEGIRGGAGGVIKIRTNTNLQYTEKKTIAFRSYPFPLTFNETKKYYTPLYQNTSSAFFNEYGVISWFPVNKINNSGVISLKFENNKYNTVKLFIEGFANDGTFIFEEKIISLK